MTTAPAILREIARVRRGARGGVLERPDHVTAGPSVWTRGGRCAVEYWGSWDLREALAGRVTTPERSIAIESGAIARELAELAAHGAPLARAAVAVHVSALQRVYEAALAARGLDGVAVIGFDEAKGRAFEQLYLVALDRRFEPQDDLDAHVERLLGAMRAARERLVLAGSWPFGAIAIATRERSPIHVLLRRTPAIPELVHPESVDPARELSLVADGVRWVIPPVEVR